MNSAKILPPPNKNPSSLYFNREDQQFRQHRWQRRLRLRANWESRKSTKTYSKKKKKTPIPFKHTLHTLCSPRPLRRYKRVVEAWAIMFPPIGFLGSAANCFVSRLRKEKTKPCLISFFFFYHSSSVDLRNDLIGDDCKKQIRNWGLKTTYFFYRRPRRIRQQDAASCAKIWPNAFDERSALRDQSNQFDTKQWQNQ